MKNKYLDDLYKNIVSYTVKQINEHGLTLETLNMLIYIFNADVNTVSTDAVKWLMKSLNLVEIERDYSDSIHDAFVLHDILTMIDNKDWVSLLNSHYYLEPAYLKKIYNYAYKKHGKDFDLSNVHNGLSLFNLFDWEVVKKNSVSIQPLEDINKDLEETDEVIQEELAFKVEKLKEINEVHHSSEGSIKGSIEDLILNGRTSDLNEVFISDYDKESNQHKFISEEDSYKQAEKYKDVISDIVTDEANGVESEDEFEYEFDDSFLSLDYFDEDEEDDEDYFDDEEYDDSEENELSETDIDAYFNGLDMDEDDYSEELTLDSTLENEELSEEGDNNILENPLDTELVRVDLSSLLGNKEKDDKTLEKKQEKEDKYKDIVSEMLTWEGEPTDEVQEVQEEDKGYSTEGSNPLFNIFDLFNNEDTKSKSDEIISKPESSVPKENIVNKKSMKPVPNSENNEIYESVDEYVKEKTVTSKKSNLIDVLTSDLDVDISNL